MTSHILQLPSCGKKRARNSVEKPTHPFEDFFHSFRLYAQNLFGIFPIYGLFKMRTLEEVRATLEIAKLKEDDLQKTIHCLSLGENVSSADYCLMELDDTLCKHIEAGNRSEPYLKFVV